MRQTPTSSYTINVPLHEVRQHYKDQMERYCVGERHFEPLEDCEEYLICEEATCDIRRYRLGQDFTVRLYALSPERTEVDHVDRWED